MSAPLVVTTKDGVCWTRRTITEGGLALYAPAGACDCPEVRMATLEELAAHGIAGSADVLPVPVGAEQGRAADVARVRLAQYGERTKTWSTASYDSGAERALYEIALTLAAKADGLRARVAELAAERHTTNEALSEAAEQLRTDRDRIAALERLRQQLLDMLPDEPCIEQGLPNQLDAAEAEYGAWGQVADALGVALPYKAGDAR